MFLGFGVPPIPFLILGLYLTLAIPITLILSITIFTAYIFKADHEQLRWISKATLVTSALNTLGLLIILGVDQKPYSSSFGAFTSLYIALLPLLLVAYVLKQLASRK